jgi:hypothetical protein
LHQFQEQSEAMQRNPHSYQIATGYRTFYSLSLIYQPITKKRLFFGNNTVFFTESYGHFMQINRIFAIIQPPFQANRRLLKNRQESKSDLSTNK